MIKIPSPVACLFIAVIAFSPTYFRSSESKIVKNLPETFKSLFGEKEPEELAIDVGSGQDLLKQVIVVKANNLRLSKPTEGKSVKTDLINRLFRLSREFSRFENKLSAISPENGRDFSKFSSLCVDYLATIYAIHYLENGKYPDSVSDENLRLSAIPIDTETPIQIIQTYSKNHGRDYIQEFLRQETKVVKKNEN